MKPLLQLKNVHAYYGRSAILRGVNFAIYPGEIVALLGRNGAGRSTCLKSIMGIVQTEGEMYFREHSLLGQPSYRIAQAGIAYVPEHRDIFPTLTVEQNLLLGIQSRRIHANSDAKLCATPWRIADAYTLFPILQQRQHQPAGVLSGGEQQMLALARSLLGNPQLLLVDEPTEGLAPLVIQQLLHFFQIIRQRGIAILLVEQKMQLAQELADRFLILGHGKIVFDGRPEEFHHQSELRREWLQV